MVNDRLFGSLIVLVGFLLSLVLGYTVANVDKMKFYAKVKLQAEKMAKEQEYDIKASQIVDYYYRKNMPVRFEVVKKTLQAIDYYLPYYFPEGPFVAKDFIAIAMVESSFNQYLVGTSGEKGIFQIMEESSDYMGVKKNQFDIDVNTELGMFVLKGKFDKHQDYRKAIIAYNGVIVLDNGKWRDIYWKKFTKARAEIDTIFKE